MSNTDTMTKAPYSQEAEQVVLGSMLAAPNLIGDITGILAVEDFYEPRHATIVEHLRWLFDEGKPVEANSLITRMREHGELDKVGGPAYIVHLARQASVPSAMYYAEIVGEDATTRRAMDVFAKGLREAQHGNGLSVHEVINASVNELDQITEKRGTSDVVRAGHVLDATIDRIEELSKNPGGVTGVPTGFYELDRLTYGLHPGQMITVAGRPGAGKSTLALDFARSAAIKHGLPTAVFSLEMSVEEINMRLLSAECMVELSHIRSGTMNPRDWERIARRMQAIQDAPLFVDDNAGNTMSAIRQKCRRLKQRGGLSLIIIDYLQLMKGDGKHDSRQAEVSDISRNVKLLAKEMQCPVIAVCQLNRGSEQRGDNRPKVSDLRESGAIEQDSDAVMLVHREDMYDPESARVGEADIIIGKQRSAPPATAILGFQGGYSRFADLTRENE